MTIQPSLFFNHMVFKLWLSACLLLCFTFFSQAKPSQYEITQINDHVYILSYPYSPKDKLSIGVVIGDQGVTLINTMMRSTVAELEHTLRTLTDKPVRYVINSNYDWWSTSANQYFAQQGATIIAHQDTQYMTRNHTQLLFKDKFELDLGTEQLFAYRSGGHSFGHINIVLKQANLIWLADSFKQTWPTIFGPHGLKGYRQGLASALNYGNEKTQYVAGSSSNKTDLLVDAKTLRQELSARDAFYTRAQTLIQQGKSNQQIISDPVLNKTLSTYSNPKHHQAQAYLVDRVRFHSKKTQSKLIESNYQHLIGRYKAQDGTVLEVLWYQEQLVAKAPGWFIAGLVQNSDSHYMFNPEQPASQLVFSNMQQDKYSQLTMAFASDYQGYLSPLKNLKFKRL